ncbi:right-handed parallel beta-helix repeat-containing protein [Halopiger aswanensis]|uniref:Parallel beta helix pectate lyase-like protein n=1 Tax=Halopiger aswanensis TaxID=148449 RepID=A0A419W180_9EURY|nr:right-handed parallel beta-helix repeat-containing protein [Halopiger aswanensis]RKD89231.1 parallel beta helix pectate lyase-like protein [Halopiger aswanensis]
MLGIGSVGTAIGSATPQESADRGRDGRPWNRDVDANEHTLFDLHSLDVDHVHTAARDADALVWRDEEGILHVDTQDETLYSGEDFTEAVQTALDSLTDGRDRKERVVVAASGTVTDGGTNWDEPGPDAIDVPSNVVLDVRGTIRVDGGIALRALDAENIEIPRAVIRGEGQALLFRSVRNVHIGRLDIRGEPAISGVRIDGFAKGRGDDTIRCEDIQIDSTYIERIVEGSNEHAFETYAVDRLQLGEIIVKDVPTGAGVLLNDTQDATVGEIVALDIDPGGGYGAFRLANSCTDITCGQVVARNAARGVFTVSDTSHATVNSVNIAGTDSHGVLIQDGENITINGGVIKDPGDEGVRIDSRSSPEHRPAESVSVSNLRIVDESGQEGISVTVGGRSGKDTNNVRVVNNDVRDSGGIYVESPSTIVRDNVGDGIASGSVTLESGAAPAARVEDIAEHGSATLDLRAQVTTVPDVPFAWDHRFEWTGDGWDLVIEWESDPGEDLELNFVADQPQVTAGLVNETDDEDEDDEFDVGDRSPGVVDGFENGNLDEYEGSADNYEVTSEAPIAEGNYSLKGGVNSDNATPIVSTDGLERYPSQGTTFSAEIGFTEEMPHMGIVFGAMDVGDFHLIRLENLWSYFEEDDPDIKLQMLAGGDVKDGVDPEALEPGEFHELVVEWSQDDEITVTLHDPDGAEIASVTGYGDGRTAGGIGTRRTALLDDITIDEVH